MSEASEKSDSLIPPYLSDESLCGKELFRYYRNNKTIFDFFFFGIDLVTKLDEAGLVATKVLAEGGDRKHRERLQILEKNPRPAFKKLQSFGRFQAEVICIRLVDNFSCFLSETIQSAMLKRPEMLRSSEQVKLSEVLRFTKYQDLVEFLVNRKVNELSYRGIQDIEDFLVDRVGCKLTETTEDRDNLSLAIELRNIYTHTRGVVSEVTLKRLKGTKFYDQLKLGDDYHVGYDEIIILARSMFKIACDLDLQFSKKFRFRRIAYGKRMASISSSSRSH